MDGRTRRSVTPRACSIFSSDRIPQKMRNASPMRTTLPRRAKYAASVAASAPGRPHGLAPDLAPPAAAAAGGSSLPGAAEASVLTPP